VDEPLRLGQATELSFAPAALHAFTPADRQGQPRLEVRFFGLFGPNGPLPLHLTAYARERKQLKDATLARFADLFHHRFLLLFYRAWAQAQPAVSLDRPGEDRFADFVGALAGVGGPEWRGREAVSDHVPLAFAGLLSHPVRSAEGLERLLGHYLKRPVRVEQFVGRWMPLPREVRSRLGGGHGGRASSAQLGRSAVLGGAVYDRQHNIRLHLGALDRAAFEALLPGSPAQAAIAALMRHYLGLEFEWELQLEADLAERPAIQLGRGPRAGRLGWTSWMGQAPKGRRPMLRLSPRATPLRPEARPSAAPAPHSGQIPQRAGLPSIA
jgi:type VI secretion system protein ImpH